MNCFCVKTWSHQPLELLIFTPVTRKSVIASEVGHSGRGNAEAWHQEVCGARARGEATRAGQRGQGNAGRGRTDRKSTRLNSSHVAISYAVFCLKKTNKQVNERGEQTV